MMEKQNVVEEKRTPEAELTRPDEHWDKEAAGLFVQDVVYTPKKNIDKDKSKSEGK